MPYTPDKFTVLGVSDPPSEDKPTGSKPFALNSQQAVELLESILPAEKAQAVPYVLIWEIDPTSGKAKHARQDGSPKSPISLAYVTPPRFGNTLENPDQRFRERPPVSLERVAVRSQNPRGIILYRTIELTFVVHRPDVVFDQHIRSDGSHVGDADSWSSLVTPGEAFAMEYGWSASNGVKNGILNGEGFANAETGVAIQGREQVRFYVTNYKFKIQRDASIRFNIYGYELGESGLRQAYLVRDPSSDTSRPTQKAKQKRDIDPYGDGSKPLEELLKKVQDRVADPGKAKDSQKKGITEVPFGLLIDVLFHDVIKKSYSELGFEFKQMYVGCLNGRAGKAAPKYSGGADASAKPISDFTFPLDDVEKVFRNLMHRGTRLTVYNFMEPFLRLFSRTEVWDRKGEKNSTNRTVPQIICRSISRRNKSGKIEVYYYIFDVNAEFTKFTKDDAKKLPRDNVSRNDIKKVVNDKGIPFISLVRANSYIQDADFESIQDEQMSSIFVRRYFGDKSVNRQEKVTSPDLLGKEDRAPAAQQIFSPVINGSITMLGNFVLDNFGLVWLDFGVSLWDGPFTVFDKEDVIVRGVFTTTMKVFSNATDPLGTKSRKDVV